MSANGISRLPFKRQRQEAKLNLAAGSRESFGRPRFIDLSSLPTLYGVDSNDPADIIVNPRESGLRPGRPWSVEPLTPAVLYSNFDEYIIDGTRQATSSLGIRGNVFINRQIIVTAPVTINGFRFIRVPPSNWSSFLTVDLLPTLSIISGDDASIDGGTNNKTFFKNERILNPDETGVRLDLLTQYDIFTVTPQDDSETVLTEGVYNINMNSTAGNIGIATLLNSSFPIDESGSIYPSSNVTSHLAMEIF